VNFVDIINDPLDLL